MSAVTDRRKEINNNNNTRPRVSRRRLDFTTPVVPVAAAEAISVLHFSVSKLASTTPPRGRINVVDISIVIYQTPERITFILRRTRVHSIYETGDLN